MKIKDLTTDQLKEEIARREKVEVELPKKVTSPDTSILEEMVDDYVSSRMTDEWTDDDLPHYIFECAVETFYGDGIFKTLNAKWGP